MNDENGTETIVNETPSSPDALSPAEQAYFDSRGEDTSGFEASDPPATPPDPPAAPSEAPPEEQKLEEAAKDDDAIEGEIELDENGRARNKASGRFVPHSAMHKERERRKGVESELEQFRDKYSRAEERLKVLNDIIGLAGGPDAAAAPGQTEQARQPADELGPAPDPEEDIFGFVKWQAKKIELMERGHNEQRQQEEAARQNQQYAQEVQTYYKNDAIQYLEKQPDFPDAYKYVANSYASELRAQGIPEDRVNQVLMAEEARIAAQCRQEGRSPSEVIYQMALARGYSKPEAEAAAQEGAPPPAAAAPAPQQRIANIQRAQNSTVSLSKSGGSSGEGLTLEALADMPEEEFNRVAKSLSKSQQRQLFGG